MRFAGRLSADVNDPATYSVGPLPSSNTVCASTSPSMFGFGPKVGSHAFGQPVLACNANMPA
jgi:hypothetical protein